MEGEEGSGGGRGKGEEIGKGFCSKCTRLVETRDAELKGRGWFFWFWRDDVGASNSCCVSMQRAKV